MIRLGAALAAVLFTAAAAHTPPETSPAAALPSGLADTPPMGWNSWNTFGCAIDEGKIRSVADAMVTSGMRDAGYRTVVVDDCWFEPQRDAHGSLVPNRQRFPSGMAALGDYLHDRGFRFGIYMSPNNRTCAQQTGAYPGNTGSGDHERQDARSFASWGVDYLKYDWCFGTGSVAGQRAAFTTMRDALAATGRPIFYSINPNSNFPGQPGETHSWRSTAHMSRTTEDIQPLWDSGNRNGDPMGVRNIVDVQAGLSGRAQPGYWNDPDMLEIGVYGANGYAGLTPDERRTHLSMWAMFAAPLIAGNDPRTMSGLDRDILNRADVLAVDQDPLGAAATRLVGGDRQVWSKPLKTGTAVALYNRGDQPSTVQTTVDQLGLPPGEHTVRDLWSGRTWRSADRISAAVPAHGTALLRLDADSAEH